MLEGTDYYKILIYAPLQEISKRELERCKIKPEVSYLQQDRRIKTLHNFIKIYQTMKLEDEPYIDQLSYQEVEEYIADSQKVGIHPDLENTFKRTLKHFNLDKNNTVKIAAIEVPDLCIDTGETPPSKCVSIIKKFIYNK